MAKTNEGVLLTKSKLEPRDAIQLNFKNRVALASQTTLRCSSYDDPRFRSFAPFPHRLYNLRGTPTFPPQILQFAGDPEYHPKNLAISGDPEKLEFTFGAKEKECFRLNAL